MHGSERLFDAVERVRREAYPELDHELVARILNFEVDLQDDPAEARSRVRQSIAQWAADHARQGDAQ